MVTMVAILLVATAKALQLPRTPMDLHGVSVSPRGFVAILTDGKERLVPLQINDVDTETVKSAEALCLLQLMQGIDMAGPVLPPERLFDGLPMDGQVPEGTQASSCRLTGMLADSDGLELTAAIGDDSREVRFRCTDAFEAVALALRYKAPMAASDRLLEEQGIGHAEGLALYPQAYTWRDAAQQDERVRKDLAQKMTEATGTLHASSVPTVNANRVVPRALLEKALAISIQKGDTEAEARIRKALDEQGLQ